MLENGSDLAEFAQENAKLNWGGSRTKLAVNAAKSRQCLLQANMASTFNVVAS